MQLEAYIPTYLLAIENLLDLEIIMGERRLISRISLKFLAQATAWMDSEVSRDS